MTTVIKPATRDLDADLAICEAATDESWETDGNSIFTEWVSSARYGSLTIAQLCGTRNVSNPNHENDCIFIAAAREGWPYAIRRAQIAEQEIDRLRNELQILQEQLQQHHRSACYD